MPSTQHHRWMAEALRQARKGLYSTHPNPRVGCVVVADGAMIAAGWHQHTGGPHAEVNAIEFAEIPRGTDFYVTLEPCSHHGRTPPCVDALLAVRPARVIVAMRDPNPEVSGRGLDRLRAGGIEVICGVLETQARELNAGFVKRMEHGLPYVSVKMACSLDGRSALGNGVSQWITGEPARRDVQFLRARASAILSSAQTVLADDPSLNLRLSQHDLGQAAPPRLPVRVLLDSNLRLKGSERIFSTDGEIWIYTCSNDMDKKQKLTALGARVFDVAANDAGRVALPSMLRDLASRGINEVHTECGQTLAGALITERLADRIMLYMAPHLMGSGARGSFDLGEISTMAQRKTCRICDIRQVGEDLRLTLDLEQD